MLLNSVNMLMEMYPCRKPWQLDYLQQLSSWICQLFLHTLARFHLKYFRCINAFESSIPSNAVMLLCCSLYQGKMVQGYAAHAGAEHASFHTHDV